MNTKTSNFARITTYDAFLFAEIGEEPNGMRLSVVSALARLDLDPWGEASVLAAMPTAAAQQRLSALLTKSFASGALSFVSTSVNQLIRLLPGAAGRDVGPKEPETKGGLPSLGIALFYVGMGLALALTPKAFEAPAAPASAITAASPH